MADQSQQPSSSDTPAALPAMPDVPEQLDSLTREQLVELHGQLDEAYPAYREAAGATPTAEAIGQARQLRQAMAAVAARVGVLDEEHRTALRELDELDAVDVAIPTADDPPEGDDQDAQQPAPAQPQPVAAAATPARTTVTAADVAAGRNAQPAAVQQPVPDRPRQSFVAAAGQSRFGVGQPLELEDLGHLLNESLHQSHPEGLDGQYRQVLASVPQYPTIAERGLRPGHLADNDRMIRETVDAFEARRRGGEQPQSITAAFCGPFDWVREIPACADASETLSLVFAQREASRGGYQYTPPAHLSVVQSGVVEWTDENQAAINSDVSSTWKPCVTVACPSPTSVTLTKVPACLEIPTDIEMSSPEQVRQYQQLLSAQRARVKVGLLLRMLWTGSIRTGDSTPFLGALNDTQHAVLAILERAQYDDRLARGGYMLATEPGFGEALVADRTSRGHIDADGDSMDAAFAQLRQATGIQRVLQLSDVQAGKAHPFGTTLPAAGGSITSVWELRHQFRLYLFDAAAWLYSETGQIDTGIESSPELARRNMKQLFQEEFFTLARVGCAPAFTIDITLCPNGVRAELVTGQVCTS